MSTKTPANTINWYEIPVADFERARKFYSKVLALEIAPMDMGPSKLGFIAYDQKGVCGAIAKGPDRVPGTAGAVVFLNGGDDLAPALSRVEKAGGKVLLPKTGIGEYGFIAYFSDTEGNRVGFHSAQ